MYIKVPRHGKHVTTLFLYLHNPGHVKLQKLPKPAKLLRCNYVHAGTSAEREAPFVSACSE